MDTNNTTNQMCGNCECYGIVENNVVTLPCTSCACVKGYVWNGKKCYGVNGISSSERPFMESTLEELIQVYVFVIRPRYEDGDELLNGLTPDEYILNNLVPDEGKDLYKEIVASLPN
jgi:hypothetical protein